MDNRKINNIVGWVLFFLAFTIYLLTLEPTTSLWDCSEYISSTHRLEVGHPPGAPIFAILGALFTAFAAPDKVAFMMNVMSATCGALGVMFLFWIITHFTRKLQSEYTQQYANLAIVGSGIVGALTLLFLDTYWFNSTESELQSMSTVLTVITFWAATRWESAYDRAEENHNKWIVFIFFVIGLSVGVRMMALLTVPAIAFLYYFKTKKKSTTESRFTNVKQFLMVLGMGVGIVGLIQFLLLPNLPIMADRLERLFVNDFGLPFHTGLLFFLGLIVVIFAALFYYSQRTQSPKLEMITLCTAMILLGYFSYALIVIRANADLPMNQNKPDTMAGMRSYILRERYGKLPFLYGAAFNAPYALKVVGNYPEWIYESGHPTYIKIYEVKNGKELKTFSEEYDANEYIRANNLKVQPKPQYIVENYDPILKHYRNQNIVSHPDWQTFFPRLWNGAEKNVEGYRKWSGYDGISYGEFRQQRNKYLQENNVEGYKRYVNAGLETGILMPVKDIDGQYLYEGKGILSVHPRPPKLTEHLAYFFQYQWYWMYFRYFLWNYSGKQNNVQGSDHDLYKGQWITGLPWIDSQRLGDQHQLPDFIKQNPGHNTYFYFPFFLGLFGLWFHYRRNKQDAWVITFLLMSLGTLLAVFLNMSPEEPRERDYVFGCAMFPFAIWVGMSVFAFFDTAQRYSWATIFKQLGRIFLGIAVILLLEQWKQQGHFVAFSGLYLLLLTAGILSILKFIQKPKWIAVAALGMALIAPLFLALQNWDDHDRSGRYFARELGKAYLNSCRPNSIIFTQGDNDTFPLWYGQDVEGFRPDVRVANTSLFQAEWAINQLRNKIYNSEPFTLGLPEEKYRPSVRNYILIEPDQNPYTEKYKNTRIHAKDALKFIASDKLIFDSGNGFSDAILPTRKVYISVNKEKALAAGIISAAEIAKVPDVLEWDLQGDYLTKAGLGFLDLLAHYEWDRPIYFTSIGDILGQHNALRKYFRLEKMAYVLTPIENPAIDFDLNLAFLKNTDGQGLNLQLDNGKAKTDYYVLRNAMFVQMTVLKVAEELIKANRKQDAAELLTYSMEHIIPYRISNYVLGLGENSLHLMAKKVSQTGIISASDTVNSQLYQIYSQNLNYFTNLKVRFLPSAFTDIYEATEHIYQAYSDASEVKQQEWMDDLQLLYQTAHRRLEQAATYNGLQDANYLALEISKRYEDIFGEPLGETQD